MSRHQTITKFGRERGQRRALLKSLAVSLLMHGKIETSEAKAKALRPFVERLVTLAKGQTIASRRLVVSRTGSIAAAARLFETLAPKYKTRSGGYTRIMKLGARRSDGAAQAVIEFV